MEMKIFICNPYRECTYVVTQEGKNYLIDPGMYTEQEINRVMAYLREQEMQGIPLGAVLVTHYHPDHCCGLETLQKTYPTLPVVDHQHTADLPQGCRMMATPGHKEDAVCFYWEQEKTLFSGDTLFCESIGRTDLPGGDMGQLIHSLNLLKQLPDDTHVYPGHGDATTIGHEKEYNPYL